jgi:hypothetical protein
MSGNAIRRHLVAVISVRGTWAGPYRATLRDLLVGSLRLQHRAGRRYARLLQTRQARAGHAANLRWSLSSASGCAAVRCCGTSSASCISHRRRACSAGWKCPADSAAGHAHELAGPGSQRPFRGAPGRANRQLSLTAYSLPYNPEMLLACCRCSSHTATSRVSLKSCSTCRRSRTRASATSAGMAAYTPSSSLRSRCPRRL